MCVGGSGLRQVRSRLREARGPGGGGCSSGQGGPSCLRPSPLRRGRGLLLPHPLPTGDGEDNVGRPLVGEGGACAPRLPGLGPGRWCCHSPAAGSSFSPALASAPALPTVVGDGLNSAGKSLKARWSHMERDVPSAGARLGRGAARGRGRRTASPRWRPATVDTHLECRRGCGGDPLTARQRPRPRASALASSRPPGPGAAASRLPSLPRAPEARVGTAPRAGLQAIGGEVAAPDSRGPGSGSGSGAVGQVAPSRPAPAFLHWEAAGGPSSSGRPGAQGRPRGCALGRGRGRRPARALPPGPTARALSRWASLTPKRPERRRGEGKGRSGDTGLLDRSLSAHSTEAARLFPSAWGYPGDARWGKLGHGTPGGGETGAQGSRRVEHPGAPRSRRSPHRRAARRTGRGRRGSLRDLGAVSCGLLIK